MQEFPLSVDSTTLDKDEILNNQKNLFFELDGNKSKGDDDISIKVSMC